MWIPGNITLTAFWQKKKTFFGYSLKVQKCNIVSYYIVLYEGSKKKNTSMPLYNTGHTYGIYEKTCGFYKLNKLGIKTFPQK